MLSLLFFTTANFSGISDTLVTGGYDKQTMSGAIKHARKETDKFIEVMNKEDVDTFVVKTPVTDHGRTEHFWSTDVIYSNGMFIGVISNDPGIVTNVGYSQKWKIRKEGTSDWIYIREGKIYGDYTIDPLLAIYPKGETNELRAKLVRQSAVVPIV